MRPLYEINTDIQQAFDEAIDPETGEILDENALDRLDALDIERSTKIESIGLYYKDVVAEADMVKAEKDKLDARQKALEKKADSLKQYLAKALDGEKFKTPRIAVSYRTTDKVEVADAEELPETFQRKKVSVEADKKAIKEAFKMGLDVPGAKLVKNTSTIIK